MGRISDDLTLDSNCSVSVAMNSNEKRNKKTNASCQKKSIDSPCVRISSIPIQLADFIPFNKKNVDWIARTEGRGRGSRSVCALCVSVCVCVYVCVSEREGGPKEDLTQQVKRVQKKNDNKKIWW